MKKNCLFILSILLTTHLSAQNKDWLWAKSSYTSNPTTLPIAGRKIITDAAGDIYVAGYFYKTDIAFDTSALINNGGSSPFDAFIVKYSSEGAVRWARHIAGTGNTQSDFITDLCLDPQGNILIAGNFNSRFLTLAGTKFTNIYANNNDIFIAKMNKDGQMLWAKQFGGSASQNVNNMVCNSAGDIFISGQFNSFDFSLGAFGLANKRSDGSYDLFIARLDSAGTPVWAKSYGGKADDGSRALALGKDGKLYMGAYTYSDSIQIGNRMLKGGDMIYAVFDSTGANISSIVPGRGEINDIKTDINGNVLIGGYYWSDSIRFGNIVLHQTYKTNQSGSFFILKNDMNASPVWMKSGGGTGTGYNQNSVSCLTTDAAGNIYAGCIFFNDSFIVERYLCRNPYGYLYLTDMVMLKYSTSGELLWLKEIGGDDEKSVNSACTDKSNDVYFTGNYASSCQFGHTIQLQTSVNGANEVFIAKLSSNATSVNDTYLKKGFVSYPNPTVDQLTIMTEAGKGPCTIHLVNMQGATMLYNELIPGDEAAYQVDISSLPSGVYIVQLVFNDTVLSGKIIKQ